jgi:hypothetical protein
MFQALELEKESNIQSSQIAGTKLNICAILSQLDKHEEASSYCISAIQDLLKTLKAIKIRLTRDENKKGILMSQESIDDHDLEKVVDEDRPTLHQTLSIAYYNLAVEYEYV